MRAARKIESLYRGSFARSEHVGLGTLHVFRMAEARSEHVGLATLHVYRMAEARSEHVGLTALHLDRMGAAPKHSLVFQHKVLCTHGQLHVTLELWSMENS